MSCNLKGVRLVFEDEINGNKIVGIFYTPTEFIFMVNGIAYYDYENVCEKYNIDELVFEELIDCAAYMYSLIENEASQKEEKEEKGGS